MLTTLSLEALKELKGGLVHKMFDSALQRIADDVARAPDIKEGRTVTLTVKAVPVVDSEDNLERVKIEFIVGQGVPKRITSSSMDVRMNAMRQREFCFNVDAPDNPDQIPLPFSNEESAQ